MQIHYKKNETYNKLQQCLHTVSKFTSTKKQSYIQEKTNKIPNAIPNSNLNFS